MKVTFLEFYSTQQNLIESKKALYQIPISQLSEYNISYSDLAILQETWSGLRALASAAKSGIKQTGQNLASAAKSGIKQTGQNLASAAGKGLAQAKQVGGQVYRGAKAAGQQLSQNVSDIYKTGEEEKSASKQIYSTKQSAEELQVELEQIKAYFNTLVKEIKANYPNISKRLVEDPSKLTIGSIEKTLLAAIKADEKSYTTAKAKATAAKQKGFFGGVGQSFKKGYSQNLPT